MKRKKITNKLKTKTRRKRRGKAKYNKLFIEVWQCNDCDFEWAYQTLKCPLCACSQTTKLI